MRLYGCIVHTKVCWTKVYEPSGKHTKGTTYLPHHLAKAQNVAQNLKSVGVSVSTVKAESGEELRLTLESCLHSRIREMLGRRGPVNDSRVALEG